MEKDQRKSEGLEMDNQLKNINLKKPEIIPFSFDGTIERASEDDALGLIEARNKSFYDDFIKFGGCPGYNIPLDEMKQRIQNAIIYKIISDGKIIGDISLRIRDDGECWLSCLEIIPEYQNKGIGAKALKYIEEKHPEVRRWTLETPVQNYRNCYFYEKMGFVKIDEKIHSDLITLRIYEKISSKSNVLKD